MTNTNAMLEKKVAIVHGGGGAIGGAIARAFARQGAHVFLTGRTLPRMEAVARSIRDAGGRAELARVDAFDATAVNAHIEEVLARAGRLDVVMNAIGVGHVQGKSLAQLGLDEFTTPIHGHMRAMFVIAQASAPPMVKQGSGVLMSLSTPGSHQAGTGYLGYGVACAAIEAMTRLLAADLGPSGVRVVCLRPDAMPEAVAAGSHAGEIFEEVARLTGSTVQKMLADYAQAHLLRRLPTLAQVAETAAFVASDFGGAMTGTTVNLSCGGMVD
jgi:3-oxoacyl-[acyl-carrier protein] reductase